MVCQPHPPVLSVTCCTKNWPNISCTFCHILSSCIAALLIKPAHSTRYDWAWRLLNLFSVCPLCFANKDATVLLLSICSKCHRTALQSRGPYCSRTAVDAIERTRYLLPFFRDSLLWNCYCIQWHNLSAGASSPSRGGSVKWPYAAMLLVQHNYTRVPGCSDKWYVHAVDSWFQHSVLS